MDGKEKENMIPGSHMLEPPPREEDFWIEWVCTACGATGKTSAPHRKHAREVFRNMKRNHDEAATPTIECTGKRGNKYKTPDPKGPACTIPIFKWARIK